MSVKSVACLTLACDVCDERFEDDEGVYHLKTVAEFIEINNDWDEDYRWLILPDGTAVCPTDNEAHASVRALLAPRMPQPEIPGQVSVNKAGDPS